MTSHPRRSMIKNWSSYLKSYRKKYSLTQKSLANRLQISFRLVENWEGDINTPPPFLRRALRDLQREIECQCKKK